MNKLSFTQKLWLPLVISLIALLAISVFNAYQSRELRIEERKNDLMHVTDVAMSMIKEYDALAQSGAMTKDDAQKQAIERLKGMRYGKDGYFSITNSDEITVMHPIKPEMNGRSMVGFKDADGTAIYDEITAVGKTAQGGFIRYVWPHVGGTAPAPKISFVSRFQPWDWIMTTGAYVDDIDSAFLVSLIWSSGILLIFAVILIVVVTYSNRSIQRIIGGDPAYAADVATRISGGDLTVRIDTDPRDQISLIYAMKRMRESLTSTIGHIKTSADNVATAAQEIAQGNTDLSQRTEQQAASLEETASSMEEITATVRQTAENAKQASTLATAAADITNRGGDMVGEVVTTMRDISGESNKMVDIISVIEGIAFQTNILALNAAVEAARAGEQGRGFAVVASEVRTLAQRSATAAKEIRELIQTSVNKVGAGSQLVEKAGSTMQEAQDAIARVTGIVKEIAGAAAEQSTGIDQVNLAVAQMDEVTQQNAALVEQASAAAQSLEEQARQLKAAVSTFRTDDSAPAAAAPAMVRGDTALRRPNLAALKRPAVAARPAAARPVARKSDPAPRAAVERKISAKPVAATADSDWETF